MSNGINFSGNVGKVNLNTGEGTQITGDGANVNTGSGTLNVGGQTFGGGIATPVEFVDRLEKEFVAAVEASHRPETPTPEQLEQELAVPDAEQTFSELRALASVEQPAEEEVKSVWGKFAEIVKSKGPELGKAVAKAALVGLQATVQTHPLVAVGMSLLSSFVRED